MGEASRSFTDDRIARRLGLTVLRWFDSWAGAEEISEDEPQRVDWVRCIPFVAVHLMCLGIFWVGYSAVAIAVAVALYMIRMFAITGFYHRYFSHRTFRANRFWQFVFALLGASSAQRGPLWWASHHRMHHRRADRREDVHSPGWHGFLWSHMGWITSRPNFKVHLEAVADLARFPELRLIDRFDIAMPVLLGVGLYFSGDYLRSHAPGLGTSGMQLLIWGFFVSTTVLMHGTFTINSLAHQFGRRRFVTGDDSRNSLMLSLITLGEGWHNNHHHYPAAARQGFYWWEFDPTYYVLLALQRIGVIREMRGVPAHVLATDRLPPQTAHLSPFAAASDRRTRSADLQAARSAGEVGS